MNSKAFISWVANATSTETRHSALSEVLGAIRTGARQRELIEAIRKRFKSELAQHGDYKKAKLAVEPLKKGLRGILWSGQFKRRSNASLLCHSGLFCGDLDDLGPELGTSHAKLKTSAHVFALFLSPSGNGLKVVVRVPADPAKARGELPRGGKACSRVDRGSDRSGVQRSRAALLHVV
jgi:BT4734-like, N-terminal domain